MFENDRSSASASSLIASRTAGRVFPITSTLSSLLFCLTWFFIASRIMRLTKLTCQALS